MSNETDIPVVVDLDGTLVRTDFLYESFLGLIKQNPLNLFLCVIWLIRYQRAGLKTRIAERVTLDVSSFPYNQDLITWLKEQKQNGRKIVLATASYVKYANAVSTHLKLFDEVIATTDTVNLKGENKEKLLVDKYQHQGFDYVGDSHADLKVWRSARKAVLVNTDPKLTGLVSQTAEVDQHFSSAANSEFKAMGLAMRPHQWLKNALLFVPLFTSHNFTQLGSWGAAILAFVSFSLCASSVYLLNDMLDLPADRVHRSKRFRPFAAGDLKLTSGFVLFAFALLVAFTLAAWVNTKFLYILFVYFLITTAYSYYLKHLLFADIVTLAGLYTFRILAGAIAIGVTLSFWLASFSIFLFLSLAIVKRHTELQALTLQESGHTTSRAYQTNDMPILTALGVASGYLSILVMALYLNSEDILKLYEHPEIIWLVCMSILYWISRVWILAYRGLIHDDPILFVIKDKVSWIVAALVFLLFIGAT